MKVNWENEKDNLYKMIVFDKKSYTEIGRYYGCTCQAIRKAAKKLNIPLEYKRKVNPKETFNKGKGVLQHCLNCGKELHSKHKHKFCSNKCQRQFEITNKYRYYLEHQEEFVGKEIRYEWLKKIIGDEQNHKCQICGIDEEWNGKELHFILDHIDGDATNNNRGNLRLICPNCDSQLDTYKSRNIGKSTRKYKPYNIK
jgi:endogenous inhibitor of DNA gyrase (YacG/DUF329 family)